MLIVAVLLATVGLRFAIVCTVAYLLLPRGPLCPGCQEEMLPIRNRLLEVCLPIVERRWCLGCGWNGVVRRGWVRRRGPVPTSAA